MSELPSSEQRSRKAKLERRAQHHAIANGSNDRLQRHDMMFSYLEGYKAALRDARKALKQADAMNSDTPIRLFVRRLR